VTGGTGSGKTTLLNALSLEIGHSERIITIEDSAELKFHAHPHVVRLEARAPNIEGQGAVSIRDLVITSLRMRPDRIVVGEVRGGGSP
jgi:pilus assembly protein CpaF